MRRCLIHDRLEELRRQQRNDLRPREIQLEVPMPQPPDRERAEDAQEPARVVIIDLVEGD